MNELQRMAQNTEIAKLTPEVAAAVEMAKQRIQSAFVVALQKPRSEMQARTKVIEACKRPSFAQKVEYRKPVGGKFITGASVRLAELIMREWENILVDTQIVSETPEARKIKVSVTDLESNTSFTKDFVAQKTVERKYPNDREIVGERTNTKGEKVFIVLATEDELENKINANISKIIRNEGLRLIPEDIIEEALETARKTLAGQITADPAKKRKEIADAFASIGISPLMLEKKLGHTLETITPPEIVELHQIYRAIKDGEAKWSDYMEPAPTVEESAQSPAPSQGIAELKQKLKKQANTASASEEKGKDNLV